MSCKLQKIILISSVALACFVVGGLVLSGSASADEASQPIAPVRSAGAIHLGSTISPTSDFVLYGRSNNTIWIKDDAGDTQLLAGARPKLSPNGRYLAYQSEDIEGDIYVYDLQTLQNTKVFTNPDYVVNYSWTADSNHIYFDYSCYIYVMDRDGSNLQQVSGYWPSLGKCCYNDSPSVNPVDGRLAWENENYGIAVADGDGQNPYWITNTVSYDYTPRWSPDGEWVVFWRNDNLYKIKPDGTGLTQLTFLSAPDYMNDTGPWTPDGKLVVTAGLVDGAEGLYAVSTAGDGRITPVSLRTGAASDFVGSVGSIETYPIYLPLVIKQ